MRDKIILNKEMIPYTFDIPLNNILYNLTVKYNKRHDFFTLTLKKGGEIVCEGEPIVYGVPLFSDIYRAGKYPALDIVPFDESGEQDVVTFENLGDTVFLTIDNGSGGEDDVE